MAKGAQGTSIEMNRAFYFTIALMLTLQAQSADPQITLVDQHKTSYVIHHAMDAPETAKLAALELQQTIQKSTGVLLTIASEPMTTPAIRIVSDGNLRMMALRFDVRARI